MAWKKEHKEQSKQRILQSAARLFTHRGFDAVSIDDVMQDAGMTRGAFYAHFKSKSGLYAQAIGTAANAAYALQVQQNGFDLSRLCQSYLQQSKDDTHICPLAFLINDIAHDDQQVRDSYGKVFEGFVGLLQQMNLDQQQALQAVTLLVGGVAIANTLPANNTQQALLEACENALADLAKATSMPVATSG